jgi:putative membrane protein
MCGILARFAPTGVRLLTPSGDGSARHGFPGRAIDHRIPALPGYDRVGGVEEESIVRVLLRLLITSVALWVAVRFVPGVSYDGTPLVLLGVALVFGVVNTIVKPIVTLFSLPAVVLTLGVFLLVINALMLWFTGWLSTTLGLGFHVEGFRAAFLGAVVVGIVAWALSIFLTDRKEAR